MAVELGVATIGAVGSIGSSLTSALLAGNIKGKSATDRRIREQYQTLVKDLRLAGLNPALAYGAANASSSATGTALGHNVPGADITSGIGDAMAAYRDRKAADLADAQGKEADSRRHLNEANLPKEQVTGTLYEEVLKGVKGAKRFLGLDTLNNVNKVNQMFTNEPTSSQPQFMRSQQLKPETYNAINKARKKKPGFYMAPDKKGKK